MSETRKIIGCIDVPPKKDIAFPSVRVWINSPKGWTIHGLKDLFPDRGTVYLHVSACNGGPLVTNQIGLFNCQQPEVPGRPWKVSSTLTSLARVIHFPLWERVSANLALWDWLNTYKEKVNCSILLGDGTVYVQLGKNQIIGPLSLLPDGKLTTQRQVHRYEDVKIIDIQLARQEIKLVDTSLLSNGHPLILNPKDAIQRRLKLASDINEFKWLSREKKQELSAALAEIKDEDGSEWVMESLPRALEALGSSKQIDENLAEEILKISSVSVAIETEWKKKNTKIISENEQEIKILKDTAANLKQPIDKLRKELASINIEKTKLEEDLFVLGNKVDATKADAQKAFDGELKRLAQSPESMAIIGAWVGASHKSAERLIERSDPLIRIQRPVSELPQAVDLKSAIFNNLKSCNISPLVSMELTAVCQAALAAGQPIAFRSLFADLLAGAIASALGQPATVWADMPAGLLDPIDWGILVSSEYKGCPRILQNANRSDIPLVLGSIRRAVLEQALGIQKPDEVVLMTLEANSDMQVTSDYPIGPLIDERVLRFNAGKVGAGLSVFSAFAKQLPSLEAVTVEEFAEVGDGLRRLPLFALSAHETLFRRAFAALRKTADNPGDVPRLFFKYWCLPRCVPEDVIAVLEAHKVAWANDKSLMDLKEILNHNG